MPVLPPPSWARGCVGCLGLLLKESRERGAVPGGCLAGNGLPFYFRPPPHQATGCGSPSRPRPDLAGSIFIFPEKKVDIESTISLMMLLTILLQNPLDFRPDGLRGLAVGEDPLDEKARDNGLGELPGVLVAR